MHRIECHCDSCYGELEARNEAQAERIEKYEQVMQRCIEAMKGSNCLEQQWLEQALQPKETENPGLAGNERDER